MHLRLLEDVHSLAQLKGAFRGIDGGTDRWYM
jgi:hypothetical protein